MECTSNEMAPTLWSACASHKWLTQCFTDWFTQLGSLKISPGRKCLEFTYTQNGDKGINRSVEHSVPIQLCLLHARGALKHEKLIPPKNAETVLTLRIVKKKKTDSCHPGNIPPKIPNNIPRNLPRNIAHNIPRDIPRKILRK